MGDGRRERLRLREKFCFCIGVLRDCFEMRSIGLEASVDDGGSDSCIFPHGNDLGGMISASDLLLATCCTCFHYITTQN
jgi:hypothetical protein